MCVKESGSKRNYPSCPWPCTGETTPWTPKCAGTPKCPTPKCPTPKCPTFHGFIGDPQVLNDGNGDPHGEAHECAPQAGAPHACEPHAVDTSTTAGTTPACAEAIANMTTASTNFLEKQKMMAINCGYNEYECTQMHTPSYWLIWVLKIYFGNCTERR